MKFRFGKSKIINIGFELKLQDMWIGLYWKSKIINEKIVGANLIDCFNPKDIACKVNRTDYFVCFIPCVLLHIIVEELIEWEVI